MKKSLLTLILTLFLGCDSSTTASIEGALNSSLASNNSDTSSSNTALVIPTGTSWQWQLTGTINSDYDVDLYDIDLFDTSKEVIESLHEEGKKVICYFSGGSYENWRSDKDSFDTNLLGNPLDGWEGEQWLDIRNNALKPIMTARLDMAVDKGCDGVEPDNMDGYSNDSGFNLSSNDQLAYNQFIANEAHKRGLLVGLKNDLDQIEALVNYFDFAVNEQCFEYDECDKLTPFIRANKAVLNAEYNSKYTKNSQAREALCKESNALGFSTLILPLSLDNSFRYSCN